MDREVNFEFPIILGILFLAIGRALMDMMRVKLKFMLNNEEVKFKICKTMKRPNVMGVVFLVKSSDNRGSKSKVYIDEA